MAEVSSIGLPPRTARIISIVRFIVWLIAAGAAVALLRLHWLAPLPILFITSTFMSRRLYFGFFSVQLPSFEELVEGEVLTGATSAEAIKQVSRGELGSELWRGVMSVILNVGLVTMLYYPGVERPVKEWFESTMRHSALWIVGAGAFLIVLPYIVLVADRRTRETLFSSRPNIKPR